MASGEAPDKSYCFLQTDCEEINNKKAKVRVFTDDSFENCRKALHVRKVLRLKYGNKDYLPLQRTDTCGYHSLCSKYVTALNAKQHEKSEGIKPYGRRSSQPNSRSNSPAQLPTRRGSTQHAPDDQSRPGTSGSTAPVTRRDRQSPMDVDVEADDEPDLSGDEVDNESGGNVGKIVEHKCVFCGVSRKQSHGKELRISVSTKITTCLFQHFSPTQRISRRSFFRQFCNISVSPVQSEQPIQNASISSSDPEEFTLGNSTLQNISDQLKDNFHESLFDEIQSDSSVDDTDKDPDYVPGFNSNENLLNDQVPLHSSENNDEDNLDYLSTSNIAALNNSDASGNAIEYYHEDELDHVPTSNIPAVDNHETEVPAKSNDLIQSENQGTILGAFKLNREKRLGNKKKNFCMFCESYVLNFARHLVRSHSYETDVQKIISLSPKNKNRKILLEAIRKKGNFLNSSNIKKTCQILFI
ncbi:uncharacterized protein [Leptinotarsa decemlineata]|uniref:uncharacterized protein n=1 Tax=Leptinotarsa decemlineata TaxID=7539 RepID=UPI003D30A21A